MIADLKTFLRTSIPDYMVPAYVVIMDALPLNPNGKVDRKLLPAPEERVRATSGDPEASLTKTEAVIASIWRDVLDVDEIYPEDNFFDLGGHSLLAMQAANHLESVTDVHIHPKEMIYQTLRQIAAVCDSRVPADSSDTSGRGNRP